MPAFICKTCGVQYPPSDAPPDRCTICDDERQYVGRDGQQWTTLDEMKAEGRRNRFVDVEPGLISIHTTPLFAIGQRALLVQTPAGNFLWDCMSFIDDETVARVRELGGLRGISVSHPHFYGVMVEWSLAFAGPDGQGAPIYIPRADREWVVRQDAPFQWYEGALEVWPGLTLVRCGGHFEGSAVLHWAGSGGGAGAIMTGDSISVAADRRWVTFMRSYPNYIPLSEQAVRGIVDAVRPYRFQRIYGGWLGNDVYEDGLGAIERSAERYIRHISGQ